MLVELTERQYGRIRKALSVAATARRRQAARITDDGLKSAMRREALDWETIEEELEYLVAVDPLDEG